MQDMSTTVQARASLVIFGAGMLCFMGILFFLKHGSNHPRQASTMTTNYLRQLAIENAKQSGKHDYSYSVKQAPPPIMP